MTLPMDVKEITVVADYLSMLGVAPTSGTVTFTPNVWPLTDSTDGVFFEATGTSGSVNATTGAMSVVVPTTDQFAPNGWVYSVTENILFGVGTTAPTFNRTYLIALPSSLGSTVNLTTLVPLVTAPGTFSYLPSSGGTLSGNLTVQGAVATLFPSGDTSGATDTGAINSALTTFAGKTVTLGPGKFYLDAPIVVPPYTALDGQPNTSLVAEVDDGTVLAITAGFAGLTITDSGSVTLNGAIVVYGQSFGGYATVSEEQKIRNIMIDGSTAPASVSGILSYGRTQRVQLREVLISQVTGDGVKHVLDAAGDQPDAWGAFRVFSRFVGGIAFNLRAADSTWTDCLQTNSGTIGWFVNTCSNTTFLGCRSEHAGTLGWGYVCTNSGNSSGGTKWIACSTDQSTQHGFQAGGTINSVATSAGVALLFSGCHWKRDGANAGSGGGGFAGFYDADYPAQITMSGLTIWPGVADNGSGTNSPQIGLLADSGSLMNVTGAYIQGATTAVTDNSGGGINWDNSVVTATGTTASPTIVAAPALAAYSGKTLALTPPSGPSSDPLFITNANSGERSFGIRVAGQANDRFKLTSDGKIAVGSGSATQDVALNRPSAGIFSVTDAGAGGSAMLRVSASASQAGVTELVSAVCNGSGDVAYISKVTGDTVNRLAVDSNGKHFWGSGSATADTNLYRTGAGLLATDGGLSVGGVPIQNGQPADMGYLGWAWDNTDDPGTGVALGASGTAGAGVLNLIKIPLYGQSVSSTGVRIHLTTLGSGLTSSENFLFLFSSGGTFVAATADQTTAWNTGGSTGAIDANWTSGPFTVSGAFCWVAAVYNGTTGPSLSRGSNTSTGLANGKLAAAVSRYGSILTGITTASPGGFTPSSITQRAATVWAAIF